MSAFKLGGLLGAGLGKLIALPAIALETVGFNALSLPIRLAAYVGLAALLAAGSRDFLGTTLYLSVMIVALSEYFRWRIHQAAENTGHVRGNQLVSADTVKQMVAREKSRFSIGGVPFPERFETRHMLLAGSTGVGKTKVLLGILKPLRETSARALCVDIGGNLVSKFYREGDIVLNPLDARSVPWSPLAEVRGPEDYPLIAKAIIPDGEGSAAEWQLYAQRILAAVLQRVHEAGGTNSDIVHMLTGMPLSELREALAGLPVTGMLADENSKMMGSVMAICATYATPLAMLDKNAGADAFSVTEWVEREGSTSWLFCNFTDRSISQLKPIITAVFSLAISALLSLKEDPDRRIAFVMDEFDSLGRIQGIDSLLTRGRRFGGFAIVVIQSISQMFTHYGRDVTNTLCSCLGSQVVLRLPDPATAEWASQLFGDEQRIEAQHSENSREFGTERGDATSYQLRTDKVVLPSELQQLPDLTALLNIVGDIPPCAVRIEPINPQAVAPEFIRKTA